MNHSHTGYILAFCLLWVAVFAQTGAGAEKIFTLTPDEHGMVLKTPGGKTVFRYMTKKPADSALTANSVCCLYPVNTPSGESMVDFAPNDHPHHRGVFLAWHSTEGTKKADFWGWGSWAPTEDRLIENRGVKLVEADDTHAVLAVENAWTVEGKTMIDEATTITARQADGVYLIDLAYKLTPTVDVTLDHTAFGGFCVKARKDGKAEYRGPGGVVTLPAPHHLKPETDWPAADWYDYTTELGSGRSIGIAIVDHPDNPATTWHNLATISMVNPCIVSSGAVELKAGKPLALRYRLVVHDGPTPTNLLNRAARQWKK